MVWRDNGDRIDSRDIPSSTTDLGQGQQDTPDLTLVAETILANKLQFGITICQEGKINVNSQDSKRHGRRHAPCSVAVMMVVIPLRSIIKIESIVETGLSVPSSSIN